MKKQLTKANNIIIVGACLVVGFLTVSYFAADTSIASVYRPEITRALFSVVAWGAIKWYNCVNTLSGRLMDLEPTADAWFKDMKSSLAEMKEAVTENKEKLNSEAVDYTKSGL